MSTTLYNISALAYYRIPPLLFALMPDYPDLSTRSGRHQLRHHADYLSYIPLPLHETVFSPSERHNDKYVIQHLVNPHALPPETVEIDPYLSVASPLATLFSLATRLSIEHLCMLMYEFCGTFSAIKLKPEHSSYIQSLVDERQLASFDAWRPVLTRERKLTTLWKRPPLIAIDELLRFAGETQGLHGHKNFAKAASLVFGVAASPFEVQTAMRLGLPRAMGGEGIGPIELNRKIRLTPKARKIAQKEHCYADLYIEPSGPAKSLVIECQSRLVHNNADSALSDSDRSTALQSMGYNVILVTSRQISQQEVYQTLREHIAQELDITLRPKTQRQLEAEKRLCRNLFIDWTTLGL